MTALRATTAATKSGTSVSARVAAIAWIRLSEQLDTQGQGIIASLLTPNECNALVALYAR